MKLTEKQKVFIRKAYHSDEVCSKWTREIRETFPNIIEASTKIKSNQWYTFDNRLIFVTDIEFCKGYNKVYYFGMEHDNESWTKRDYITNRGIEYKMKKVSENKALQILSAEADKRGYKKGNFKCLKGLELNMKFGKQKSLVDGNLFSQPPGCGGDIIFSKGEWAPIITTITVKDAEEKLGCKIDCNMEDEERAENKKS